MQPEINGTKQFPPFFYPKVESVPSQNCYSQVFLFFTKQRLATRQRGQRFQRKESRIPGSFLKRYTAAVFFWRRTAKQSELQNALLGWNRTTGIMM
jgi:hypothetical protein